MGLGHEASGTDAEGDRGDLPGGHVDAVDPAVGPEDHAPAVRCPCHGGVDAVDGPDLLQVPVQAVENGPLPAGGQIAEVEGGLVAHLPDEGQCRPVGRGRGPDGSARAPCDRGQISGLPVHPSNGVDPGVRVLPVLEGVPRRHILRKVEVAAVRREDGLVHVLLVVGPLGEPETRAPAPVVEPHLAGSERPGAGEVLPRHDVLGVRGPARAVQEAETLPAHLPGVRSVPVHDPDVVPPGPVTRKGDEPAVGRIARLHVPGEALGELSRLPSLDGDHVDLPQEIEGDLGSVGAHVEAHPGPFPGVDLDLQNGKRRIVHIPLLGAGGTGRRRVLGLERDRRHPGGGGPEPEPEPGLRPGRGARYWPRRRPQRGEEEEAREGKDGAHGGGTSGSKHGVAG